MRANTLTFDVQETAALHSPSSQAHEDLLERQSASDADSLNARIYARTVSVPPQLNKTKYKLILDPAQDKIGSASKRKYEADLEQQRTRRRRTLQHGSLIVVSDPD